VEIQSHLHAKLFQLLQQVAVVENQVKVVEDLVVAELLFIVHQETQVTHPQHHPLKEILEEAVQVHTLHQLTQEAVAVATAVLEVMLVPEMMEHQEQEQQILLQDHL
jgi:hypothetical protein|tara:strand:+ start:210 stop:530 length:321 start_codon:yes stop_codon:yes gene_type:complete